MKIQDLHHIYKNLTTTRELRNRVPLQPGYGTGFSTVPDGEEEITYNVYLDQRSLKDLARKAAGQKSQKTKAGPILVSVMGRRRLPRQGQL